MSLEQAIRTRYSARRFLSKQVPRATIQKILDIAQQSPSWCNTQPWQLTLLSGAAQERFRASIYDHARSGATPNPDFPFPEAYLGVYRERRKVCGVHLYESVGIKKDDKAGARDQALENFRLFGAPHTVIITTDEALGIYGAIDCGLYVGTFLYAAKSLGVDTIAQAALASYPDFLRKFFGLAPERKVVCGISFGYADAEHAINSYRTGRASYSEAVTFLE
ncbi:MAG: nitroreductase [Burkholderiales bacterium]